MKSKSGLRVLLVNRGMAQLYAKEPESAYTTLKKSLDCGAVNRGALYVAAGYYNLGIACRRTGRHSEAIECFNEAKQAMPNSIYAFAAERALKERN